MGDIDAVVVCFAEDGYLDHLWQGKLQGHDMDYRTNFCFRHWELGQLLREKERQLTVQVCLHQRMDRAREGAVGGRGASLFSPAHGEYRRQIGAGEEAA